LPRATKLNITLALKIEGESPHSKEYDQIIDNEITLLELANKVISVTGSTSKIVHLPALKEGDMLRRCPDITNMNKALQHEMTTIEDGIGLILSEIKMNIEI
jgi:hypothetical protein